VKIGFGEILRPQNGRVLVQLRPDRGVFRVEIDSDRLSRVKNSLSTAETGRGHVYCSLQDVHKRFGRNVPAEFYQETLQIDNMAQISQMSLDEIDIQVVGPPIN
jgi:hypothetical protein